MYDEITEYRRVIGKYLGRYGMLSSLESAELQRAYEAVHRIQERCFHEFSPAPLFTSNGWVCESCGLARLTLDEDRESA